MNDIVVQRNKEGVVPFVVNFVNYSDDFSIQANCNSITFINQGTSIADINGVKLYPQQSLAIDGNLWEWDNTNYNLSFNQSTGDYNNLIVIRKTYQ